MCSLVTGVQTCALPICQFRFILPFSPSASAKAVIGIRQRWAGLVNHVRQKVISLSSRALLTGLGLLVGFICLSRTGKPQVIDWSAREIGRASCRERVCQYV